MELINLQDFSSSINTYLMQKRLIIIASVVCLILSQCPANRGLQNLQVGSVDLSINSNSANPLAFTRAFSQPFAVTPQVAVSFHDFSLTGMNMKKVAMKTVSNNPQIITFFFEYDQSSWSMLKVGFWATTRTDITLGQAVANVGSLMASTITVTINLDSPIPNYDQSIVRVYINGMTINSASSISIRVFDQGLAQQALRVGVQAGADTNIAAVPFSYLIFSPQMSLFASYGGGFNLKNFQNSKVYDIHKITYQTEYVFFGLMGVTFSGTQPIEYSSTFYENMYLQLKTSRSIDELTLSYIAVGAPPASICSACANQNFAYADQCMAACPAGSFPFTYRDGGKGCRTCPAVFNFQVNAEKNGCACKAGFEEKDGYCQGAGGSFQPYINDNFDAPQGSSFIPSQPVQQQQIQQQIPQNTQQNFQQQQGSQSFVPNPSQNTGQTQQNIQQSIPQQSVPRSSPSAKYVAKDCSGTANTYWTGYRCACRVGFISQNGMCVAANIKPNTEVFRPAQFIYKISKLYTAIECRAHEMVQGDVCVCVEGYKRSMTGICEPDIIIEPPTCPPYSSLIGNQCICNPGYQMRDGICERACPDNSYDNGIGVCVCNAGYYDQGGVCVKGQPCPAYSSRNAAGVCVCNPGYTKYGDHCSRCPEGQIFVAAQNRCIRPCGINEELNPNTNTCMCKAGYGKHDGICSLCPSGYFVKDGYCVLCPIGSSYSVASGKCECNEGLKMGPSGFCESVCSDDKQKYNPTTKRCQCLSGLGFSNGQCIICPNGVNAITNECITGCGANEVLLGSRCICQNGFGYNSNGQCIVCTTITGGFLVDGYCATCPVSYIYNGQTCVCPAGSTERDGRCEAACETGQLTDANGICYWCPLNQVVVDGRCECREGYQRLGNFCEIACSDGQYVINGRCARCALNTVYNVQLGACVCAEGYYKNSFGYCEQVILPPVSCDDGSYFVEGQGCMTCPTGCSSCSSATVCTACTAVGYIPSGAQCVPNCGDGRIIYGVEQCDDNNKNSGDGCSGSCQVEAGYACNGQPSICQSIITGPVCGDGKIEGSEGCDDNNVFNGDGCSSSCSIETGYACTGAPSTCTLVSITPSNQGMKLKQDIMINSNNAFILIRTDDVFTFNDAQQMKSFMKYEFPDSGTVPTSAYCMQMVGDLQTFQCLMIYSSGLPNYPFNVDFSFNKDGKYGFLQVEVDPQAGGFASRSLL